MDKDKRTPKEVVKDLRNEDPVSHESGAHPVGTGVGTALGGAVAGAAAGLAAGPIGTVAGAVIGGLAGGIAGKAVAEEIDPTVEIAYWKEAHAGRPYVKDGRDFEYYEPAYQVGIASYDPAQPLSWEEREEFARLKWENDTQPGRLSWDEARPAAEDAYKRLKARSS